MEKKRVKKELKKRPLLHKADEVIISIPSIKGSIYVSRQKLEKHGREAIINQYLFNLGER